MGVKSRICNASVFAHASLVLRGDVIGFLARIVKGLIIFVLILGFEIWCCNDIECREVFIVLTRIFWNLCSAVNLAG